MNYNHKKKFKLNELKAVPFSISKHLRKLKANVMKYPPDIEKFAKNDQKYMNTVNNSILRTKIFETLQHSLKKPHHPYSYRLNKFYFFLIFLKYPEKP